MMKGENEMSNINEITPISASLMEELSLKEFTCIAQSEEYRHFQLIHRYGSLWDLYMMLEFTTGTQQNWIVTIPKGFQEFVNLRVFDGISLYDLEQKLEGKFPDRDPEHEMYKKVLYSLMNPE